MKKFMSSLVVIILLSACEKEINLDIESSSSRLVVEGHVLAGLDTVINMQTLELTKSAQYTGNTSPESVTNANVQVSDGVNTYHYTHQGEGLYQSKFIAEVGKTYTLKVKVDGEEYEASETIGRGSIIESLRTKFFPSALGSPEGDFVVLKTTDLSDMRNFYFWRLYINDQLMINPSPGNIYRAIQKDDFFNGQALIDYQPYDNFNVVRGDRAVMQQLNISEALYDYYYAIFNLTGSSPVSGDVPPGNIRGNVINKGDRDRDALGYFGACTISIKTIIIP